MAKTGAKKPNTSKLVSFKISEELYAKLESYASGQKDEPGFALSPSQAARRMVINALDRLKK